MTQLQGVGWPAYSNDTGPGTDGTVATVAFFDSIRDSINTLVHSATNPTLTPAGIIDEVKNARGSMASLDARLDVFLNEDGSPKALSGYPTNAIAQTLLGTFNLIPNGDMLLWSAGDAAAPDYFTLVGGGATVARVGTGLGDTNRAKYGDYAAKVTFGASTAALQAVVVQAGDITRIDGLKGRKVSFGCWVKTSNANHCKLVVSDNASTTSSSFHTGSGNYEFLTVTHTVHSSAAFLLVQLQVVAAGSGYFGDLCAVISDLAPADFVPCPMQKGVVIFKVVGNVTTGTNKDRFLPGAPGIVTDVQLECGTAPTGQPLIVDVNTWDGAAHTSMFSTRPQIAAGATVGGAVPDSTYARRCFSALFGSSLATAQRMNFDVDQIGSGAPGADLTVHVRVRQYIRMLEAFIGYNVLA